VPKLRAAANGKSEIELKIDPKPEAKVEPRVEEDEPAPMA
jgi:hypothetical protein